MTTAVSPGPFLKLERPVTWAMFVFVPAILVTVSIMLVRITLIVPGSRAPVDWTPWLRNGQGHGQRSSDLVIEGSAVAVAVTVNVAARKGEYWVSFVELSEHQVGRLTTVTTRREQSAMGHRRLRLSLLY